jgi:hypothetical protein
VEGSKSSTVAILLPFHDTSLPESYGMIWLDVKFEIVKEEKFLRWKQKELRMMLSVNNNSKG